jgi:hypothetical protein
VPSLINQVTDCSSREDRVAGHLVVFFFALFFAATHSRNRGGVRQWRGATDRVTRMFCTKDQSLGCHAPAIRFHVSPYQFVLGDSTLWSLSVA